MTPKEKAEELISDFTRMYSNILQKEIYTYWAKQSSIRVVDEIIKSRRDDDIFDDYMSVGGSDYYTPHPMYLTHWKQVKEEINKL